MKTNYILLISMLCLGMVVFCKRESRGTWKIKKGENPICCNEVLPKIAEKIEKTEEEISESAQKLKDEIMTRALNAIDALKGVKPEEKCPFRRFVNKIKELSNTLWNKMTCWVSKPKSSSL
ncbi:hypothetical protein NEFER03_1491 [Nematocida sp. LUAm3]|nr:hypothetical protein NEFER03_1491 [Nematocida sp. LUAm3]KAI5174524.1 hypothetical protein NEFER02_0645 [Nematocida sp. LUAm2]KAI5178070.1 hypothetical protein NEFER01_1252 [Nematocida sp. LUAm1]